MATSKKLLPKLCRIKGLKVTIYRSHWYAPRTQRTAQPSWTGETAARSNRYSSPDLPHRTIQIIASRMSVRRWRPDRPSSGRPSGPARRVFTSRKTTSRPFRPTRSSSWRPTRKRCASIRKPCRSSNRPAATSPACPRARRGSELPGSGAHQQGGSDMAQAYGEWRLSPGPSTRRPYRIRAEPNRATPRPRSQPHGVAFVYNTWRFRAVTASEPTRCSSFHAPVRNSFVKTERPVTDFPNGVRTR